MNENVTAAIAVTTTGSVDRHILLTGTESALLAL
ncbi:hypothetical protein ZBT109_0474 [Zymobacter palmae]|uniref:Uncharacterized protein n=1 Tax=Zymobacter palmae TaxID=33074 RepID=A0A348HCB0_9GAMM|nr:hypothetical protein ZBT109_0474 [Zymobacter palmae]